jgi:hypothetical protein
MDRLADPLRYQVAQLAAGEIDSRAEATGLELDGRRDEAILVVVAGLMEGKRPKGPSLPINCLAAEVQKTILEKARRPGHNDLVLDLLIDHRFRLGLEDRLPGHTLQILRGFRRLGRQRHRRRRR